LQQITAEKQGENKTQRKERQKDHKTILTIEKAGERYRSPAFS
jgi:hypothetical protein